MKLQFKRNKTASQQSYHYAPAKRQVPKWQWYLLVVIILSPLLYFLFTLVYDKVVITATGRIVFDHVILRAPHDAYVGQVLVETGNHVKKDQILIQLNAEITDQSIEFLEKEIAHLQSLKQMAHNIHQQHLLSMQKNATQNLVRATAQLKKFEALQTKGIITVIDLNNVRKDFYAAQKELAEIKLDLSLSYQNHDSRLEKEYREKIRQLTYELSKIHLAKMQYRLVSPDFRILMRREDVV